MRTREVAELADRLERRIAGAAPLSDDEARLCAEGLRLLVDNEKLIEVADEIGRATGLPWHDRGVMRTARRIVLLFENDQPPFPNDTAASK